MDKAREIVAQILDFIENYINLIKGLIEKFQSIGDWFDEKLIWTDRGNANAFPRFFFAKTLLI